MGVLFLLVIYLIFHTPAIVLLILGINRLKKKPEDARVLLIAAGIYFIIGAGICGSMMGLFR